MRVASVTVFVWNMFGSQYDTNIMTVEE